MDQDPSCLIRVSPSDSIQEVIDHAPLGAVIELAPGTYRTNLSIGKSLMLREGGQTPEACRIEGDAKRVPAIEIANMEPVWQRLKEFAEGKRDDWDASPEAMRAHVALENLTCRSQQGAAVGVGGATDIELRSCCLVDSGTGLTTNWSFETPEPLRRVLDQLDSEQETKLFGAVSLTPIRVAMSDSTITRNECGIKVSAANVRLTATDCRIAESEEYGVLIKGSHARVELLRCSISSNCWGIHFDNSEGYRLLLAECTIEENREGLSSYWCDGEIELQRNRFLNHRCTAINGLGFVTTPIRGSGNEMRGTSPMQLGSFPPR